LTARLVVAAGLVAGLLGLAATGPVARAAEADRAWLALGDSYSSGEGIAGTVPPDRDGPRGDPNSQGRECERATGDGTGATAWAVGAYRAVKDELGLSELAFVACTGATIDQAQGQIDEAETATGRDRWDVVSFSFGGNNIRFAEVLKGCLDLNSVWGAFDLTPGCDVNESQLRSRVDMLTGAAGPVAGEYEGTTTLAGLFDTVAAHVEPGGDVVVAGYPHLVEEVAWWDGWRRNVIGNCEGVESYDVGMLRSVTGYLNEQIARAVTAADQAHQGDGVRFHFVDISRDPYEYSENSRDRHALCSRDPWLNGQTTGMTSGDWWQTHRSFHPLQAGHTNTGRIVADQIRSSVNFDDAPEHLGTSAALGLRGLGPVQAGMSLAEAEQAAGVPLSYEESGAGEGGCGYASPPPGLGLDDVGFMVLDGVVARVDIDGPSIATVSGVRVGDSESEALATYGDLLRIDPHPYTDGHYLVYEPTSAADADYELIFETTGSVVTTMRSGLSYAVDYIEGCA